MLTRRARYATECAYCGKKIKAGTKVNMEKAGDPCNPRWYVYHISCKNPEGPERVSASVRECPQATPAKSESVVRMCREALKILGSPVSTASEAKQVRTVNGEI